jgi:hypothetical protein
MGGAAGRQTTEANVQEGSSDEVELEERVDYTVI